MDHLVLQHGADDREVLVGGVDRRADAHLRDLGARELANRRRRRPGDDGWAISGSSAPRSISSVSSYAAPSSAASAAKSSSRPWPASHSRMRSSPGKTAVVAAGLDDHVADRAALGRRQRRDAGAGELEDAPERRRARRAGAAARGSRPWPGPTGRARRAARRRRPSGTRARSRGPPSRPRRRARRRRSRASRPPRPSMVCESAPTSSCPGRA